MSKIQRLKKVLQFEQQQLDDLVQTLAEKNATLQEVLNRMKDLKDRQELAIANPTDQTSIVAASNRTAWCEMLHQRWQAEQTTSVHVKQEIEEAVQNVRQQHSRVRAMESLLNKVTAEHSAFLHSRRSIELSDLVLNSYLERQS